MANRFNNAGASTSGIPANNPPQSDEPLSPPHQRQRQGNPVSFHNPTQTYGVNPYGHFPRPQSLTSLPEGYVPLQQNLPYYYPQPFPPTSGSSIPLPPYFQQPPENVPPPSYYSQYFPSQAPNMPTANVEPSHNHVPQQNIPAQNVRPPPPPPQGGAVPHNTNPQQNNVPQNNVPQVTPQAQNNVPQNTQAQNIQQPQAQPVNPQTQIPTQNIPASNPNPKQNIPQQPFVPA